MSRQNQLARFTLVMAVILTFGICGSLYSQTGFLFFCGGCSICGQGAGSLGKTCPSAGKGCATFCKCRKGLIPPTIVCTWSGGHS